MPPRQRKLPESERIRKRRADNRLSAARSRERHAEKVAQLQDDLESKCIEVEALRKQVAELKIQLQLEQNKKKGEEEQGSDTREENSPKTTLGEEGDDLAVGVIYTLKRAHSIPNELSLMFSTWMMMLTSLIPLFRAFQSSNSSPWVPSSLVPQAVEWRKTAFSQTHIISDCES